MIKATVLGVMAQRLVRLLCRDCREAHRATDAEAEWLGLSPGENPQVYRAVGCDHCNHSGYRGRTGIYELIEVDDDHPLHRSVERGDLLEWVAALAREAGVGPDAEGPQG